MQEDLGQLCHPTLVGLGGSQQSWETHSPLPSGAHGATGPPLDSLRTWDIDRIYSSTHCSATLPHGTHRKGTLSPR